MTKDDAVPQGTYEISPSDSTLLSERAGPDVGWFLCGRVGVGIYQVEEQRGAEGERDRDAGRKWKT